MRAIRLIALGVVGTVSFMRGSNALSQIVINEVVKEQRDGLNDGAPINPDTREFIELYNAGLSAVDLTGWTVGTINLATGTPVVTDIVPTAMIAPGGYYVIGAAGVPNVNFTPTSGDIWTDSAAQLIELRNGSSSLIDAVAYNVYLTGPTRLTMATAEQLAQIGSGFQGELFSLDVALPNVSASWSRYRDGRDTNKNGHDFGLLPVTAGASNNLALNSSHTVPDVDALAVGDPLGQYHASFVLPRAIDPAVATAGLNPRVIPASPQGGKAIVAWDNSGGGNAVYSKELVNSFDVYAYFDTTPIGVAPTTLDEEWESSIYGIGSADPFFRNPDPTNGISQIPGPLASEPVTRNSSTGVGWVYQQFEDGSGALPGFSKLMLVDFSDGGDSEAAGEWTILHTIDMSTITSGWYRLSINYDPDTNEIAGTFDDDEFTFTLGYDLLGTFFVGYREGITGAVSANLALHNPPTYDLFVAAPPVLAGDYNDDGKVDAADYVTWRNAGPADTLPNDPTPGTVDVSDYNTWRANFGKLPGAGAGQALGAVPEPSCVALATLGLLIMAVRRRIGR